MIQVHEIPAGRTASAARALLALRPRWDNEEGVTHQIDTRLRPAGYRVVGVFLPKGADAVAVAGFREVHALAWGHYLYVDDVSTLPEARGNGYAGQLLHWLESEARRLGCEGLHLDSGVGADRADAHRTYLRHKLRISAHHFEKELGPAD